MAETTTGGVTPKQSPYVFGIDLGTSNSGIAVFIDGRATLFQIEEGNKGCASVMSVRDNGDILVGREARRRLMIDPENTVASVKREMGTRWTKEFTGLPGEVYTPTDVSAEILGRLINGALQAGTPDIKGTPHKAVICIPANFDDAKKEATKEAGELAGLEVEWLLEEPVAAAIAYAFERDRDQTILVYDLGGGTFDVSVLKVDSSAGGTAGLRILAKEGVPRLGGDDFDLEIMKVAAARFQATSGLDVLDEKKDQGISVKSLREAQQKLKDAAETAKWELTESQSAQITIPNFIKSEDGNVHNLDCEIKRGEFNDAVRPLLLQSKEAVERALDSAKLKLEDISRIILVGGSTRVPLVKEMLVEMFKREPYADENVDTVVARGAAIWGATLLAPQLPPEGRHTGSISITNIVTHFLGIETYGGGFAPILEKGLEIPEDKPLSATKTFANPRDNMAEMAVRIYQSDLPATSVRDEGVKCIGEFFCKGIPPRPAGKVQIEVTFGIDQQNVLKVEAVGPGLSGEKESRQLEIKRS